MAIIYSYPIATPNNSDLFIISRVPTDPDEISNFSVSMSSVADYVIDRFIDPDATDFQIPVFNQNGTRITGSIMSQDSSPSNGVAGTKITIAGDLTLERDQSDTTLTLVSDTSNIGEQNNPSIKFFQDGNINSAAVGFNIIDDTGGGTIPGTGNKFWIVGGMDDNVGEGGIVFGTSRTYGWENAVSRFIIRTDGKGLFGHPDSLYTKTLGSQFEIYDNRNENTTTDPSFTVYSVLDYAAPSGNEGAGGIKQILDVYDNGVFQQQEAMMLIPGTNSSDLATSTPLAFYTNSNMDTSNPSGFAGMIFDSGNWLLDGTGTFTTTDPGYQLKVAGTGFFTDQVTIPETPIAGTDAASKAYVDAQNTGQVSGTGEATRVAFWDTASSLSSNANLYWDNTNSRLGIGTDNPQKTLDVNGDARLTGAFSVVGTTFLSGPISCEDSINMTQNGRITNLEDPQDDQDAATKSYVDSQNTGQVSGTGTTNTLPVWSDGPNSVLSDSAIRQQTSGVGVIISGLIQQSSTFQSIYIGGSVGLQTTGLNAYNVGIGELALESFTQGLDSGGVFVEAENVAIGYQSLQNLESGTNNVAIGANTLLDNIAGANNIAIGKNSLASLTGTRAQSLNNIALGFNTLGSLLNGANNVAIGHTAFEAATSVEDSIMLGKWVGKGITPTSVQSSVIIGENACLNSNATDLDYSVIIGFQAGEATQGNITSDIFIGNNAGRQINSTGYNIAIGNLANQGKAVKSSISIGSSEVVSSNFADNYAVAIGSYDQDDAGIGSQISAGGKYSVVIGGIGNIANAEQSVVLAGKSNTIDAAAANAAIIGGFNNSISSVGSAGMALGSNLEVEGANQVVLGRYNAGNNNSKLIVGAGFSDANRINAFEVKNTSQLKLGKYGQTPANFPAPSPTLTNVLVVGVANNVTEIPISNAEFNSQLLPPGTRSVTAGSTTNLSSQEEKIVKISWTGTTGNAILRLPLASNFVNKTIRFITDSSFPATATAQITGNSGTETINGLTAGVTLTGTYQATMVWSDGTEWWVL
jgi:hypothetical protein